MNRSNVHILNLPDEILLKILKKLSNVDVLYSLLDINNGRLNILAQENIFTNNLKLLSTYDSSSFDRFCNYILPRIHHNVKCFILDSFCIKRFLRVTDYPNLTELKLVDFEQKFALRCLTDESLRSIFQEQITNLTLINDDENKKIDSLENYTINVYSYILTLFKNLKELSIMGSSPISMYPGLSLCYLLPTTFSSPILTHLSINVQTFDDCLYLLDGRLRNLTTLCVNIYSLDTSSRIIYNMDKLFNLKCFSVKTFFRFKQYDKIVSLLHRMSKLEKLTLYLHIKDRNTVIDGTYIQHDILDYMPQLHSFTFYICTYIKTVDLSYKLSNENIQQTLTNIGQYHATSIVNYIYNGIAICSIFSLPFQFDYLKHLGNKFPNIVFSYVTFLLVEDIKPFKHEFFIRIARSFPLLKYLRISNAKPQGLDNLETYSSDNCQLHSIIEYHHLTRLDLISAHKDYIEQFLNETKTFMPCLTEFEVSLQPLKAVTKNFTRKETRRNCAKVKRIDTIPISIHMQDVFLYFPSMHK